MWQLVGMNTIPKCSGTISLLHTSMLGMTWIGNYVHNSSPAHSLLTLTVRLTYNCWSEPTWTPSLPARRKPNRRLRCSGPPARMGPARPVLKAVVLLHTDTCRTKRTTTNGKPPIPFVRTRNPPYAYAVDTQDTMQAIVHQINQTAPSDPLPAIGNTTSSSPSPTKSSVSYSTLRAHAPTLSLVTEATSVPYVATATILPAAALETSVEAILYKIVTPYHSSAWHLALQQADLLHLFPNLVHDLIYGTPIGDLPPLMHPG